MNERHKELLSAFLDGELTPAELDELTAAMAADESLATLALRYQGVGEVLREPAFAGHLTGGAADLAARIRDDIAAEPAPAAVPDGQDNVVSLEQARQRRVPRPLIGVGIAAAIAVAAIGALRIYGDAPVEAGLQGGMPAPAVAVAPQPLGPAVDGVGSPTWAASQPAVERRLSQYLVHHSELSRGGMHGMLPYARVVGYRGSQPQQ